MIIMLPFISSISSNSGMAVISFDLPSTLRCPSTSWLPLEHALTMWMGDFLWKLSFEPQTVFPSMAYTSLGIFMSLNVSVQLINTDSNLSGLSIENNRLMVSWEGMPLGRESTFFKKSIRALPNSSIESQDPAPHMTASILKTMMSVKLCFLFLLSRGSGNCEKWSYKLVHIMALEFLVPTKIQQIFHTISMIIQLLINR